MSSISGDISGVYGTCLLHYKVMQMPDNGLITCPVNSSNLICTIFVQKVVTLCVCETFLYNLVMTV